MTMLCAKLPQNVSKNRYRDISPCTSLLYCTQQIFLFAFVRSNMYHHITLSFFFTHFLLDLLFFVNWASSLSMSSFSIYNLTPLFLCRWCHTGHSEKHRWLHQCKLHQCELVPLVFLSFMFLSISLRFVCLMHGGWSVLPTIKTHV